MIAPKSLYYNHCNAHKIELVLKHAMNCVSYFTNFEQVINSLHNFFYSHSHRRLQYLREMASSLQIKFYELKSIFKIRWASSYYDSLTTLKNVWKLLILNLDKISKSDEFDASTKETAKNLLKDLKNKNFLLILHFMQDILALMKRISLNFQIRGSSLIGKSELIENLKKAFDDMKTEEGSIMNGYLTSVNCKETVLQTIKCPISVYENSAEPILWQSIELLSGGDLPKLSVLRLKLLVSLISELDNLFPSINTKMFDIFLPDKLPRSPTLFPTFGVKEITSIYDTFQWKNKFTISQLLSDWADLLKSMNDDIDNWCEVNDQKPHVFWAKFLKIKNIWTSRTLTLIKTVLALPVGSSDCERSFSYLNMIARVHRNIQGKQLENLIRIRMNGPLEVSRFRASEYAYHWIYIDDRLPVDSPTKFFEKPDSGPGEDPESVYFDRSVLF